MPPHAVLGHLIVVVAPVAAVLAVLMARTPRAVAMRWWALGASLGTALLAVIATTGGSALFRSLRGAGASLDIARSHAHNGEALAVALVVLAILVGLAIWLGRGGRAGGRVLDAVRVLLVIAALATVGLTALTLWDATASVWSHHTVWKG